MPYNFDPVAVQWGTSLRTRPTSRWVVLPPTLWPTKTYGKGRIGMSNRLSKFILLSVRVEMDPFRKKIMELDKHAVQCGSDHPDSVYGTGGSPFYLKWRLTACQGLILLSMGRPWLERHTGNTKPYYRWWSTNWLLGGVLVLLQQLWALSGWNGACKALRSHLKGNP